MLFILGLVVALRLAIAPGRWRRLGKRAPGGSCLETVDRVHLTPQHSLHLVRFRDRGLLVAVHQRGCTLLDNFAWPGEVAR
ncbi:MAG: flagellar biosynthetic protein FliO [Acidobacteria bacterium]|nr:flagellar biosynthetic protein FliO [Acidobacteriota bacterium]